MIFCIMGKSASGKDSIYKEILKRDNTLNEIIMYTTRPKRENEVNGLQYFFVDENYLNKIKDKIIEKRVYHTVYGDWYYATIKDNIDICKDYIIIGTIDVYSSLIKYFGKDKIFPIYIEVENNIREKRAIRREKNIDEKKLEEIKRRFLADEIDFSDENLKKLNIIKRYINNDFDECLNQILIDIKKIKNENTNK